MPVLSAFDAPGRFWKGNLHTHSTRSDGARDPAYVCDLYREAGYDFLGLSDHFLPKYGFPITDTGPFRRDGFTTLLGAEVHAPATGLGELWHILATGLPPDFASTAEDETAPSLAARCAEAGAFVTIVHPAWYGLTVADAETINAAHAVEIYNHTSAVRTDRGDGWGLLDALLNRGRRLHAVANDDAHLHCNDFAGGWTMVKAGSLEPGALLAALKAGHCYATQGPEIHCIDVTADTVDVACSPATSVMLLGRGSASAQMLGAGLTQVRLSAEPLRKGGWARVVVVDDQGRRGWSGPFWA